MLRFHRVALVAATTATLGLGCWHDAPGPRAASSAPEPARVTTDAASPPATVTDAAGARAARGQPVDVVGVARDAKLGPVVVAGDLVVYCDGLGAWPDDRRGTTVRVRGTLEQTADHEATEDADGARTAGTDGPVWTLRACALVP